MKSLNSTTAKPPIRAALGAVLLSAPLVLAATAGSAQALAGAPAAEGTFAYTARLSVGEWPENRGCTATLVDEQWVATAASCLADQPGQQVPAGKPARKTTVTLSDGKVLEVVDLAPRADRDLVLGRLSAPAQGITPVKVATTAPAAGAELKAAGFGRTKIAWVPEKIHTGVFTVAGTFTTEGSPTTLAITGKGTDVLCKGDTGGPLLNAAGELVGINSRSWQGGCLGSPASETRTGAVSARVDGLGDWIDVFRSQSSGWKTSATIQSGSSLYQGVRLPSGAWTGFTDVQAKAGNIGGIRSSAVVGMNGDAHVVAVSNSGGLFHTIRKEDGTWSQFGDVFSVAGTLGNLTSVSAVNTGWDLHVIAVADGKAIHTVRNASGHWTPFRELTNGFPNVTAAATAGVRGELQVAIVSNGKLYHSIRQTNGNWLGWGDVAQAAGSTGPVTSISAASSGDDAHFVIATDKGTRQYHTIRNFNGSWAPFGDLNPVFGDVSAKSIAAAAVNGEVQVALSTADGKVLHTIRRADRTWTTPSQIPLRGLPATPGALALTPTWTP